MCGVDEMSNYRLVDTFGEFLAYWDTCSHLPLDDVIDAWYKVYMAGYPVLLRKQQDCYAEDGENWREVARQYVSPHLADRLPAMSVAHHNLTTLSEPVWKLAQAALEIDFPITFVIYVGIGCGAGWATEYQGEPAVLLGLENIAEEGWQDQVILEGLLAHEIGHLTHFHLRKKYGLPVGDGSWWQLYSEGFAQRCEQLVCGSDSWHMASQVGGWLSWCQENQAWLANEFLRRVDSGETIRPFFGSWYQLRGYKQTGYYLGAALLSKLEFDSDFRAAALLADVDAEMRTVLQDMAA
jgi:hypothetical protein